jgi:hypothetical protein
LLDIAPEQLKLISIFYPHALERNSRAVEARQSFVHYCDANAAVSMLQNREVWMRNTTWMNDTSEVKYGLELLQNAYAGPQGSRLRIALESTWPGFRKDFESCFSSWQQDWQQETYITCLTEQLPREEMIGRLSMWRAYGGKAARVAFVLNGGPFLRPSSALKAYTSPVAYLDQELFNAEFSKVVDGVIANMDWLKSLDISVLFNNLFAAFRFAVLCTKHPAFYEEREWRIIYQPNFQTSDRIAEDKKTLGDVPQRIYKIPMRDYPDEGFYGATLPDLLERVIIGPVPQPHDLRREIIRELEAAEVPNAAAKVVISNVPLRT